MPRFNPQLSARAGQAPVGSDDSFSKSRSAELVTIRRCQECLNGFSLGEAGGSSLCREILYRAFPFWG